MQESSYIKPFDEIATFVLPILILKLKMYIILNGIIACTHVLLMNKSILKC
jgi:hypothetical protein